MNSHIIFGSLILIGLMVSPISANHNPRFRRQAQGSQTTAAPQQTTSAPKSNDLNQLTQLLTNQLNAILAQVKNTQDKTKILELLAALTTGKLNTALNSLLDNIPNLDSLPLIQILTELQKLLTGSLKALVGGVIGIANGFVKLLLLPVDLLLQLFTSLLSGISNTVNGISLPQVPQLLG